MICILQSDEAVSHESGGNLWQQKFGLGGNQRKPGDVVARASVKQSPLAPLRSEASGAS